ncbi:MAG: DUF3187 family protein [Treponema sp.]|jgi:hypothetical protein|nr:DUF3187 family protein [Treponema sp.]
MRLHLKQARGIKHSSPTVNGSWFYREEVVCKVIKPVVLVLIFLCTQNIFCTEIWGEKPDYSKGPLLGKNMFIPYLIHYNFPALSAKSGEKFDFQYHLSTYYVQDASYVWNNPYPYSHSDVTRYYDTENVVRDYESCINEAGFAFNILEELQIGMDMRIFSYYGGFLDAFIEKFHKTFRFASGNRKFFLQNQIYINIPNDNGAPLFLDGPSTAFGDIDVWGKWTFFENKHVSLASLGAMKIPSGRLETLSGSNYPDIAFGIISDMRPVWFLTVYAQAGGVLPLSLKYYPMFNGLAGLEINPWKIFSINVQMNIKTSPISNDIGWTWNNVFDTEHKVYSMPQTNIMAGVIFIFKGFKWQFYFEEDGITNQGTDLTLNFMFSHKINYTAARLTQTKIARHPFSRTSSDRRPESR